MSIEMLTAIATLQLTGVILFELFVFSRRRTTIVPPNPLKLVGVPTRVERVEDVKEAA